MASWPSTLPQSVERKAYSQSLSDPVIRSSMGYGPAKLRRRTTADIQAVGFSMTLTAAQKATLISFYVSNMTAIFTWTDQLNGGTVNYRFLKPVQWSYIGPHWIATLALEIIP